MSHLIICVPVWSPKIMVETVESEVFTSLQDVLCVWETVELFNPGHWPSPPKWGQGSRGCNPFFPPQTAILPQQTWCQGVWQQATQQFETLEQPGGTRTKAWHAYQQEQADIVLIHVDSWQPNFMTSHRYESLYICKSSPWSPWHLGIPHNTRPKMSRSSRFLQGQQDTLSLWPTRFNLENLKANQTWSTKRGSQNNVYIMYIYIALKIVIISWFYDSILSYCIKSLFGAWLKLLGKLHPMNPSSYLTDYPFYHNRIYYILTTNNTLDMIFSWMLGVPPCQRKGREAAAFEFKYKIQQTQTGSKLNRSSNIANSHIFRTPNFQARTHLTGLCKSMKREEIDVKALEKSTLFWM